MKYTQQRLDLCKQILRYQIRSRARNQWYRYSAPREVEMGASLHAERMCRLYNKGNYHPVSAHVLCEKLAQLREGHYESTG